MKLLKIINGSFLVAGTSIGGGMLALPVLCARVGLIPSLLVMLGVWAFMTSTALIYLECTGWMKKKDAHLISMASDLLGPWGKKVAWTVFVFICYASLVAYLSGGGRMIEEFVSSVLHYTLPANAAYYLYATIFGGLLLMGTHRVGSVNSILFAVMLGLFFFMISGTWNFDMDLLTRRDWEIAGLASLVPMMLTTFSFPGIVPVLASYHKRDVRSIRASILCGTGLTVTIYAIWLCTVLGNVPWEGTNGLAAAFAADKHACDSLVHFLDKPSLHLLAQAFAFLALSTSFLGLSMGLKHFLSEGFKISSSKLSSQMLLILMIVIPALLIKFNFEKVFFHALDVSGGIGDGVLSGFIPALMLWRGRYIKGFKNQAYQFFGQKTVLLVIFLLSSSVLTYEVLKCFKAFFA